MFVSKLNVPVFSVSVVKNQSLLSFRYYNRKIDTVAKRASMLEGMLTNKDKRKNWHLNIVPTKAKARAFDNIHRPHRRRSVLNSLFITNITDVISTGDIGCDLGKYGIEISGVQVSPCFKILNVFWQVPVSNNDSCDDIGELLTIAAPKIRAELISRNVLGRVPFIYFLRDCSNARIAGFEEAMKKLELEPKTETGVVINDSFIDDIYSFKDAKIQKNDKPPEPPVQKVIKEEIPAVPHKPINMKSDVFGLDHGLLMEKVLAHKTKKKSAPQHTAVISPESLNDSDDLFSKIPGVCFQAGPSMSDDRNAILKKFQIERKMLMQKRKECIVADEVEDHENYDFEEVGDNELSSSYDYIEDDEDSRNY